MVDLAENLLEQGGYVRPREVIAIVAGTRTKSGSTNFLRLHVLGEHSQEHRFLSPHDDEMGSDAKAKRSVAAKAAKPPLRRR
jgi:pyruvate kinase